jgi:ABC-2 type transport system permease protein
MREVWAGLRLQLLLFRRNPGNLLIFLPVPFFSAIFLSGIQEVGQEDLVGYAVFGPAMVGLWAVSLDLGGSIIDSERIQQTFPLLVTAPGSLSRVLAGRVVTVTVLGMLTFAESLLCARLVFGVDVRVEQPVVLVATLVVTAVAMAGTSTAMAAVFVAARAARRFANALGYPFYILGGLLVPVSFLPFWLRPLSWATYLYWSAGLLRDTLSPQPVAALWWRLLAVLALGVATYAIGVRLTERVVDRLRRDGTIGLS